MQGNYDAAQWPHYEQKLQIYPPQNSEYVPLSASSYLGSLWMNMIVTGNKSLAITILNSEKSEIGIKREG